MTAWAQFDSAPAFPGAEGYGRYTTGGRGGEIRHVTNLNDSGTGSFRAAVNGSSKKIVVFDVAGVIALESDLTIGDNTTVLGQTAPGDGITLRYWTVRPGGNNIIRFIRFRRGQERNVDDGADATWQRQKSNIILDHCSFSWSIDEVASYYDNKDFTMQWCTIGEPLKYSGHKKGPHGYGGIWGGKGASFHHNLLIHLDNRAPRLNGARFFWKGPNGTEYPDVESCIEAEKVDLRNCVIYNTGTGNGAYGGMGGNHNIVNNYYKAGPATKNTKRVFQCSVSNTSDGTGTKDVNYPGGIWGKFYISGNYVTAAGSSAANYDWTGVTIDNCKDAGVTTPTSDQLKISEVETGSITTHTAEVAYEKVLSYAGASKSRDCIDTRYAREVRNNNPECVGSATSYEDDDGTHSLSSSDHPKGIIDVTADALLPHGGVYTLSAGTPIVDTDGDGIPDAWEDAHGLNPNTNDANLYTIDNVSNGGKGFYTNIEVYANSLVEDIMKNENKDAQTTFEEYYPLGDDPSALLPTTINASPASVSITGTASATVTLSSNNSSGAYSITTQPNASIATASISGNTVTITGVAAGTTSLIVSQDASSTHDAATKTINITVTAAQGGTTDVIYSWQMTGTTAPAIDGTVGNSTNGSITFKTTDNTKAWSVESASYNASVTDNDLKAVNGKGVKGAGNANYFVVTLNSGTFQTGDVITICGYNGWKISSTSSQTGDVASSVSTGSSKTDYDIGTVTIPENISTNTLYFTRAQSSSTGITGIKVARESSDPTLFSLDVSVDKILALAYKESSSLSEYAEIKGGSAIVYNGKNNSTDQNMVSSGAVNLGGSAGSYLKIIIDGKTLSVGDVIAITNEGNWKMSTTESNSNAITINVPYIITGNESIDIVGTNIIYLWKTGTSGDPSSIKHLEITRPSTVTATVASTRKFGSFSSLYNIDFGTDENAAVQAYTVKVKDATSVVLTRFFGVLPAGEGVVLYAPDATKSQTFNVAASATALTIDNDMIGVPVAKNVAVEVDGKHAYAVNSDMLKPLASTGIIPAGKAYIMLPVSSSGAAKAISMMFNDDNATGISNYDFFNTNNPSDMKIYNLQGIEVKNPIRGRIYIINNKKCIFK